MIKLTETAKLPSAKWPFFVYRKVASSNMSCLEAHAGFFRLLMKGIFDPYVQCTPDLVTSYLVTNPDLVTILQKTVFLLHKNILFSDNLVFSDPSI